MACKSSFMISKEDITALESSDGFRIVRNYLAKEQNYPFCFSHSALPASDRQTFLLHRDIIHSLLLPVLQIHAQASTLASQILSTRRSAELELAFRGEGRGAFSWLQCFVAEERDWCHTRGCPACIVSHVLHSEPLIRIVVIGCGLSDFLRGLTESEGGPTLPAFGFWLTAVKHAVEGDTFWGVGFWEDTEARALDMENGIKDLIRQCCEVRDLPAVVPKQSRPASMSYGDGVKRAIGVKNSGMAKRQLMLKQEEQDWMRRIILACWTTLLTEAARERRKTSTTKRPMPMPRARSLTT